MGALSSPRAAASLASVAASPLRLTVPHGVKRLDLERADGALVTIVWRDTASSSHDQAAHVRIDHLRTSLLEQVDLQTGARRNLLSDDHVDLELRDMPQVFLASPESRSGDRKHATKRAF